MQCFVNGCGCLQETVLHVFRDCEHEKIIWGFFSSPASVTCSLLLLLDWLSLSCTVSSGSWFWLFICECWIIWSGRGIRSLRGCNNRQQSIHLIVTLILCLLWRFKNYWKWWGSVLNHVFWEGNQCVDRLAMNIGSSSDMALQDWEYPPLGSTPLLLADRMEIVCETVRGFISKSSL